MNSKKGNDLLILGAGHLGARIGTAWMSKAEQSHVYAVTRSLQRHPDLKAKGFTPLLSPLVLPMSSSINSEDIFPKSDNLVIAIPPSNDYLMLIQGALKNWQRRGPVVFISSTSVYSEDQNGEVIETSPTQSNTFLTNVEELVVQAGGMIVRLAGLYDEFRGPHLHYMKVMNTVSSSEGYLNLIHTDDAADLVVQCLLFGKPGACYLGCDEAPILRKDFINLLFQKVKPKENTSFEFQGVGPNGKRCNGKWTQQALQWKPIYSSFKQWWEQSA